MTDAKKLLATGILTAAAMIATPAAPAFARPLCPPSVHVSPQPSDPLYPDLTPRAPRLAGTTVSVRRYLQSGATEQLRADITLPGESGEARTVILYAARPGCSIDDSRLPYRDRVTSPLATAAPWDSFVSGYRVRSGPTSVQAMFRPFTVHLVG